MASLLPPGRLETRQVYAVHQQQRQHQHQQQSASVGANGGSRELIVRAANSRRRYVPRESYLCAHYNSSSTTVIVQSIDVVVFVKHSVSAEENELS